MKIFFSIFFVFFSLTLFAQAKKGDWFIRGNGYSINETVRNRSISDMRFGIGVGYFVSDYWMAGGGLNLRLANRATTVGNEVFVRYYLKDTMRRSRIFLESRIEKQDNAFLEVGSGNSRFAVVSGILAVGSNYFLTEKLAIEARLDYYFINKIKRPGVVRGSGLLEDYLTIKFGLQYFFRYRDFRKEQLIDYRTALNKGKWSVGGMGIINETEIGNIESIQKIQPRAGYFIFSNWEVGSWIEYNANREYIQRSIGLIPYSRYYLNIGRKRKLFVEGFAGYINFRQKAGNENRYLHIIDYGAIFGISNFITKEVSLEVAYRIARSKTHQEFISRPLRLLKSSGLTIGLSYYFDR